MVVHQYKTENVGSIPTRSDNNDCGFGLSDRNDCVCWYVGCMSVCFLVRGLNFDIFFFILVVCLYVFKFVD